VQFSIESLYVLSGFVKHFGREKSVINSPSHLTAQQKSEAKIS